jgi:NADH-quinone oxidoreductase subunit A
MSEALASSLGIVAYLALFFAAALSFLFINLIVGRLVRAQDPHPEKLEIYECGEPTIGSSFVQFDIRFYVVALLFIIFDVEVAFFFPWATVFGKATNLADDRLAVVAELDGAMALTPAAAGVFQELGVRQPGIPRQAPAFLSEQIAQRFGDDQARQITSPAAAAAVVKQGAAHLALLTLVDILAFFGVLMIGFLYVWRRGDLNWVRAVQRERVVERGQRVVSERRAPMQPVMRA